jgi:large conductance mechanosensitive channel
MSIIQEFKKFAMEGSVIDLAVGFVVGAAFKEIVTSLVNDIITPAVLTPALKLAKLSDLNQLVIPGTAIKYGSFLSSVISFVIVAFTLFMVIKAINATKKKSAEAPAAPVEPTATEKLLMEIRDNTRK